MLKGGVIMDVVNVEQARIAEEAGAVAVMVRVPAENRIFTFGPTIPIRIHAQSTVIQDGGGCLQSNMTADGGVRNRHWNGCQRTSVRKEEWHV